MKFHSLIRAVMILTVAMVVGPRGWATVYFQDGFNYPVGSAMYTNSPWSDAVLGNTNLGIVAWTNSLTFATNGATLQDFSPAGVAVLETNGTQPKSWFTYSEFGTDLVLQHSNPPAIYTSFLLNFLAPPGVTEVATGQGDANCSIMEMGATNGVSSRGVGGTDLQLGGGTVAWDMMYDAANHYLGVEECAANIRSTNWNVDANVYWTNTATAWYSNSVIATNVTYLVVLKYMVTSNVLAMYINPTPGAAEPAPNLVVYGASAAFTASYPLGYISLDTANGNNQRPPTVIDSLRIASTWAEVTPAAVASTPTTTALILSSGNNPSTYGDTLAFQATVSPVPPDGENVIFYNGALAIGTNTTASGVATLTTSTLVAGSDSVTALYIGDATYAASSNSPALSQTVNQETPTLTAPTASDISSGQTLASSLLTGGAATNAENNSAVAGSFAFTTPSTEPSEGTTSQSVTFTPTDITDFTTATTSVNVTVNAASLYQISTPVLSGTTGTVNYVGQPDDQYALETTSSLNPPVTWTPVVTNTADDSGNVSFSFGATNGAGFYQVISVP